MASALADLKSGDWILQSAALRTLVRQKHALAVPAIKELLTSAPTPQNAWIRSQALICLAELQGPQALNDVTAFTADTNPVLRGAAAEALGIIGKPGLATIERLLKDAAPAVRLRALVAYARVRGAEAWPTVQPLLASKDLEAVRWAAQALVFVRTTAADQKLLELLGHADKDVRLAAASALTSARVSAAVGPLLKASGADADLTVRALCQQSLAEFPIEQLQKPLLEVLNDPEKKDLYGLAMTVLEQRPSPSAAQALAAYVRERPQQFADILAPAIAYLGKVNADEHQAIFILNTVHASEKVRRAAAAALGRTTGGDLWKPLRPLLTDAFAEVRLAAYQSLAAAAKGAPAEGILEYLAPALTHKDPAVRDPAMAFLAPRLTPAEAGKAVAALDACLSGAQGEVRVTLARMIEPLVDDAMARKLSARQGYLTDWRALGPYQAALNRTYLPEIEQDTSRKYPRQVWGQNVLLDVADAASGGASRPKCLRLSAPMPAAVGNGDAWKPGHANLEWAVRLPRAKALALKIEAGLQDGSKGPGLVLEVRTVDGEKPLLSRKFDKVAGWQALDEADLSALAGKDVRLRLSVWAAAEGEADVLAISEFVLLADKKPAVNLLAVQEEAAAWVEVAGESTMLAWQPAPTTGGQGFVTLAELTEAVNEPKLAYAVAEVNSPVAQPALLRVTSPGGFKLWHNGQVAGQRTNGEPLVIKLNLAQGANRLFLKVASRDGQIGFSARLSDEKNVRIDALMTEK